VEQQNGEMAGWLVGWAGAAIVGQQLGRRQDNGNRSNQESKFDFLATHQCLVKIDEVQQKIKIVRTNRQSNLLSSCQSIFSLCRHHPSQQLGERKGAVRNFINYTLEC